MRDVFLVFVIISYFSIGSRAQNFVNDTTISKQFIVILNDSIINDSIQFEKDSIDHPRIRDTLNRIFNIKDTLEIKNRLKQDSLENYDSLKRSRIIYDEFIIRLKDSLIFEKPDSVYYVVQNLNRLIDINKNILNDTTKRAIDKLIYLSENREAEQAIVYLQNKLNKTDFLLSSMDSSLVYQNDLIQNSIYYLIKNLPEDSINFAFTNTVNDSILFTAKQSDIDSVHLKLYDNRGEFVILWIKKSDRDVFDIFLEDGVYLEKIKKRKVIDQRFDSEIDIPELRDVKKFYKILPIWIFEGLADIKFNQSHVSESWAQGGESSVSVLSILKYSADFSYGKKRNLDTDVEYRLGFLKAGDKYLQKNDDKFEINIKYDKFAFKNWYYSGLLNFKTQFLKGYDYSNDTIIEVSAFLSPAYLIFSLGLDYKPNNKLTVLLSPITSKFTIVADTSNFDRTRFGVGSDESIKKEIGAYIKAISKIKFKDNITLENKINFFTNYVDNPQNVDVDWEANLIVTLNDYIKMSVNAHFIYDDNIDIPLMDKGVKVGTTKGGQFKELFGIGFSYNF